MIPKIIHYIWLGGREKPALVNICILSWREKNPDYTIIEWNESNLNIEKLASENRFFAECRKRHMWAHMTDYIRLSILYELGGIYLDTDMLALKGLDDFLEDEAFMGKENGHEISCGIMGFEKGSAFIKSVLEFYGEEIWHRFIWTIPQIVTCVYESSQPAPKLTLYDREFFYPYPYNAVFEQSCVTKDTVMIHWWAASWNRTVTPYLFLTTKHVRNPAVRLLAMLKRATGYYLRRRSFPAKTEKAGIRGRECES